MSTLRRIALTVALSACLAPGARAEMKAPEDGLPMVEKTSKRGLKFWVPEDWPIEEKNGQAGPVNIEEYLAVKFKAMDQRLQAMEQLLQAMDIRVRLLEERAKAQSQSLKSSEGVRP